MSRKVLDGNGTVAIQAGTLKIQNWPRGHSFALFLTHDVDQIHDRELWRVLADINHTRRVVMSGERGNLPLAVRRIWRSIAAPKTAVCDFADILELEGRYNFRSTFFILDDVYWARHGARYRLSDPEIHEIVRLVIERNCEIGAHGGYYRFNNTSAYRDSLQRLQELFHTEVVGIRNHHLRFSGRDTWRAQADAGFAYDTTFGSRSVLGPVEGHFVPFWPLEEEDGHRTGLLELPLTAMDTTIFRHMGLQGDAAYEAVWRAIEPITLQDGLVTLLWHNNFFNEPEYNDWENVYGRLLDRLSQLNPWCATGKEIDRWWRCRDKVGLHVETVNGSWRARVSMPQNLDGVVLEVPFCASSVELRSSPIKAVINRDCGAYHVHLPCLKEDYETTLFFQPA